MANDSQSRTARRNQQSKKGNKKPVFKKVLLALLITGIVLMIVTGSLFAYYVSSAPELNKAQLSDPIPSRVYDMNGELFAELGSENRTKISYSELPDVMRDAVLATEDARFFEHSGIDIRRIGGAVFSNITSGFGSQGASTITQQVVKRSFLSPDKTLERKVQEQWLAIKLEQQYSKEEIFEMYMNKIYYDSGAYGVAEAAETYYGITDLQELTLPQAALLAGLPQRPAAYNPIKNPEYAKERRDRVLDLMVHHEKITEQEAEEAKSVEIEEMLNPAEKRTNKYQAFLDQVQREVEAKLDGADIYEDGLRIYTTVEPKAQEKVEELLSKDSPLPFPDDELQTATTVVDTQTGAIRAIGGSRSEEAGGYNYAIQGGRQAGSTFKPIMAYGPVIENKKWSTYHQYDDDGPVEFPNGDVINNYNDKYYGWVSMREALYRSLNNPAIQTIEEVGLDNAKSFAEGLGIEFKDDDIYHADAIGGAKTTATPKELAGAYAAFGNEGVFNEPYAVEKVVLPDDEELDLKPEPKAAMSKYTAYMITDMLKSVMTNDSGTGRTANISGLPVAGKTGTTNSYAEDGGDVTPDAWFNGYTTNYSISTWTGYGEGNARDIGTGKDIPKQLFKSLMTTLSEGKDTKDFTMPDTVKRVEVEKGSNPAKLPSDYTPDSEIITELFHVDNMPSETSEEYDRLDPVKDLKAKYNKDKHVIDMAWDHDDDVSFEVSVSVDGSDERTITTTDKKSLEVTQINEGSTYKFTIRAVGDDSKSEGKSVEVTVPGGDAEQEEDTDEENQDEEENENEDQGQGNNGNNGNGQGNGNNNGNGRGNGNEDGDTGDGDSGDSDSGDSDTGDGDSGDGDSGDGDSGDGDSGDGDSGGGDSGDGDSGNGDSGDGDSGDGDSNEDSNSSLLP
ncbi:transglycosylase domain-containing protein [Thalassobacillus sp. B23F22_16]|uniref:transglycosylase domain-containing protein n=1 Tax=Thalassobacillus sp. B23F22_16 TaxID=3459513 RepID=UPI00373FB648